MTALTERDVHDFLFREGLEKVIDDRPDIPGIVPAAAPDFADDAPFELWRIIKQKTLEKIDALHRTVRYGEFIGSKIKLPTDHTTPMELDLLGQHEGGLFVLELKVGRSAERQAFSELFAYSNYLAGMFALSGHKDITNVLVAALDAKITRQAFLYDLLIADRNMLAYVPRFDDGTAQSLRLSLHVPTDDDFRHFTNRLLAHGSMACVVASFDDMPGWIDAAANGGELPKHTAAHLTALSGYTAQPMEQERLHGFVFVRRRWPEIKLRYPSSLVICALNPFKLADLERSDAVVAQLDESHHGTFHEFPMFGFDGRLATLAKQAVRDCLANDYQSHLEFPRWDQMVVSPIEVAVSDNVGFCPTGVLREAYVAYLTSIYEDPQRTHEEDMSPLKLIEVTNWLRAWQFMEMCGFTEPEA